MKLSTQNAERIARELRDYLGLGRFAYVSANETSGRVETFSTGHRLQVGGWMDSSQESVRIFTRDDGTVWIGFSIYGWVFSICEGEDVWVDRTDGVQIRHTAPCGNRRLDWLKLEGIDD